MFNRTLTIALLAITLTACHGKMKQDQADSQQTQPKSEPSQAAQTFDTVNSQAAAAKINQQNEVEVSDRVFFNLNESSLSADAKKVLDNQVAWLKSDSSIKVIIEGHCDERGTREYNLALGERRANSVKQYLTSNGVSAARVKTISYGKERPAFVGSGEEIWSKNRRVVTVVRDNG